MDKPTKRRKSVFLPLICLAITIGLFLAGLWPMNFSPENRVRWLNEENGVRFQGFGMAYFPGPLIGPSRALGHDGPVTLELCVHPQSEPGNMIARIVSLYDGREREVFLIGQWRSHLIIRIRAPGCIEPREFREIELKNVLAKGDKRFLTIVSGKDGTMISVDGVKEKYFPRFALLSGEEENSGVLVLGNSPDGHSAWEGDLFCLAIYNRLLEAEVISRHYQNWVQVGNPIAAQETEPVLFYLFADRKGAIATNERNSSCNLLIPEVFHVLQRKILVLPWEAFRFDRSFVKDVVFNIFGFVPIGFFFAAWLGYKKRPQGISAAVVVILIGCGISLSIELLQVYLPTRNSSLTDLICNILGTALGQKLCTSSQGMGIFEG